jgi:hypothetical protein
MENISAKKLRNRDGVRRWRAANRDAHRQSVREWRKVNPEKSAAISARRRDRLKEARQAAYPLGRWRTPRITAVRIGIDWSDLENV